MFSLLLACTCLLSCTAAASSLLISADRQQQVFVVLAACAVLKFVLDAVAIRHWQLWGAAGAFATRGFLGEYKVCVTHGGETRTQAFTLTADGADRRIVFGS